MTSSNVELSWMYFFILNSFPTLTNEDETLAEPSLKKATVGFWDSTETFTFAGFDILYHRKE